MDQFDIKARLARKGYTLSEIARIERVAPCTVSLVVSGHTVSMRLAVAIARVVEREVDDLWPGRYPLAPRILPKSKVRRAA